MGGASEGVTDQDQQAIVGASALLQWPRLQKDSAGDGYSH